MSYLVLARKWRPQTFADLVGQDHVSRTLANAIAAGRVAHAFLFTGVRGVGKTTSARIMAKALNCQQGPTASPCLECAPCREIAIGSDVDVQEIEGASYNGVDEVRKLQETLPYRPARDRHKIFIVDEVHMLSSNAWNAFLKTLEEPPPHVKFIFATTEVHKVPITILSRCQRYDFKLIPSQLIARRLRYVLDQEHIAADEAAISLISREAGGSLRDAMSLLDQAIAWSGDKMTGEEISRVLGVAGRAVLARIARAIVQGNSAECLDLIGALADQGFDVPHVARDLLSYLRDLVVAKVSKDPRPLLDCTEDETLELLDLVRDAEVDDLVRLQHGLSQTFDEIARSGLPRTALEMALIRLAHRPALRPIDELLDRLDELEQRLGSSGSPPPGQTPPSRSSPSTRSGPPSPSRSAPPSPSRAAPASHAAPLSPTHPAATPSLTPSALPTTASQPFQSTPQPVPTSRALAPSHEPATPPSARAIEFSPLEPLASSPARLVQAQEASLGSSTLPTTVLPPTPPAALSSPFSRPLSLAPTASTTEPSLAAGPSSNHPSAVGDCATASSTVGTATVTSSQARAPKTQSSPPGPFRPPALHSPSPGLTRPTPESVQSVGYAGSPPSAPSATRVNPGFAETATAAELDHCLEAHPATESTSTVEMDAWREILGRIRAFRPALAAVLEHASPIVCCRDRLVLGYEPGSFFAVQATEGAAVDVLTRTARSYFSAPTQVAFDLSATPKGTMSIAALDQEQRRDQLDKAKRTVSEHVLVKAAIELLDAELREVRLPE